MRPQDIEMGETYRIRSSPDYSYVKALELIKPHTGVNVHGYIILKCEHTVYKSDRIGFIRYFRPADLIKQAPKEKAPVQEDCKGA